MRLFTGFELPADLATELAALLPIDVAGLRRLLPEQMHVTLHFIGSVPDAGVDRIRRALHLVERPPCLIQVRDVGAFRLRGRRAILWAGIEPTEALLALHADVGRALATTGFEPERRPYQPHVTVARLTCAAKGVVAAFLESGSGRIFGSFAAPRYVLYRSDTREDGARYTAIESYLLR